MIRLRQINVLADQNNEVLLSKICKKLCIDKKDVKSYKIIKKSIDARHKPDIFYSYELDVELIDEKKVANKINNKDILYSQNKNYAFTPSGTIKLNNKIVVVGAGPAGLFASLMLIKNGYKVLVIERGKDVDSRKKDIESFWNNNILNENSNICFGEGGAGTFSDGKLNTSVGDKENRQKLILETFVEFGAPEEILYEAKPHIGTDNLIKIVKNMRNKIIELGGEFRFETCLTNLIIENNCITSIEVNNKEIINCEVLVLAIGHSARDTFKMLNDNKLNMKSKPFAIGIRIMHNQDMINYSQYGEKYYKILKPASYKLTYNTKDKRGVYSFCMCPGGYVVNSSSEKGLLLVNGMSNYKRESSIANSAIIVSVNHNDYGDGLFDGMKFQEKYEKIAYEHRRGNIPIQLYKDFKNNKVSEEFGNVLPKIKGNYEFGNVNEILPSYINNALIEGIEYFGTKIKNYNCDDAIICGIESRTSSPIRIERNEFLESNISGIYPSGEGAGYAGGITSAAMDGIKIFESITTKYYMN